MDHAASRSTAGSGPKSLPGGYLHRSELPLASLVLLLPLIVLYEIGTQQFATDPHAHTELRIVAFKLMQDFFWLFGASGRYLPAMAIVCILLAWHIARSDPWQVKPATLAGMAIEGTAWSLPLLIFGTLALRYLANAPMHNDWRSLVVLSVGAGLYEELVFRLIAFTVLSLLLIDIFRMQKLPAFLAMVVITSLSFSLYHYLGSESFEWQSFVFRTAAGMYFGALFLSRGFGITAFAHAAYDVIVVLCKTGLIGH